MSWENKVVVLTMWWGAQWVNYSLPLIKIFSCLITSIDFFQLHFSTHYKRKWRKNKTFGNSRRKHWMYRWMDMENHHLRRKTYYSDAHGICSHQHRFRSYNMVQCSQAIQLLWGTLSSFERRRYWNEKHINECFSSKWLK